MIAFECRRCGKVTGNRFAAALHDSRCARGLPEPEPIVEVAEFLVPPEVIDWATGEVVEGLALV